jgi:hypothetical protein
MAEYWDERSALLTDHRFGYAAGVVFWPRRHGFRLPGKTWLRIVLRFRGKGFSPLSGVHARAFAATKATSINQWFQRAESPLIAKIDRLSKVWQTPLFKAL